MHLSPKAFDVLCVLVEARPTVVNKHELHDRIWPGTFVVDANLSVLIGEIRRALGDSAQTPQYIRTVHKVGYAFCGDARGPRGTAPPPTTATAPRYWLAWNDRRFMLSAGENLIGRNPECAIWIDASGVSRRHARVRLDVRSGAAAHRRLGSTNGTFVNEARVESPVVLARRRRGPGGLGAAHVPYVAAREARARLNASAAAERLTRPSRSEPSRLFF